jgi:hypothetical protein
MSKKIENFWIGDEFMIDWLDQKGELSKAKAKLISYHGMGEYVIDLNGTDMLVAGDIDAYPIIDDMVYENEIDKWVNVNEYK